MVPGKKEDFISKKYVTICAVKFQRVFQIKNERAIIPLSFILLSLQVQVCKF